MSVTAHGNLAASRNVVKSAYLECIGLVFTIVSDVRAALSRYGRTLAAAKQAKAD